MSSSPSEPIHVLLISGQALFCAGLRLLIDNHHGMVLVGQSKTLVDAGEVVAREKPDIILLDIDIDRHKVLDTLPLMRTVANGARVILLTRTFDSEVYSCAVRVGVKGFVLKEQEPDSFFKAITKVHAGEVWLDRSILADVIDHISNRPFEADPEAASISLLTERELEVIDLVCEGLRNKQIAQRLHISESTVRHHLTSIFNKLDLSDRFTLVLYAFRHGLAEPPVTYS